jgi:pyroglutamyl-peptidase
MRPAESNDRLRILITGFGPFPGAPYNPTPALVTRLLRIRRPALSDVELIGHIFRVSYADVDRDLPELLDRYRPDAMLMFGLATRTPHIRIETRARNAISQLWPDVSHRDIGRTMIARQKDSIAFGPHTHLLYRAALATGVPAALSRDAGRYLCNYLCWRSLEAVRTSKLDLATFVHVPLVPRLAGHSTPKAASADDLLRAGQAVLLALVPLVRRAKREARLTRTIS